MTDAGLWVPRRQQPPKVYQPRARRSCLGELIQIDGSEHPWFEDRAPQCTLLVYVDDATSRLMHVLFTATESTFSYFEALGKHLAAHGKPVAFYSDKSASELTCECGQAFLRYSQICSHKSHFRKFATRSFRPVRRSHTCSEAPSAELKRECAQVSLRYLTICSLIRTFTRLLRSNYPGLPSSQKSGTRAARESYVAAARSSSAFVSVNVLTSQSPGFSPTKRCSYRSPPSFLPSANEHCESVA